jgi:Spy/CpxP family protein refolding chaperone
MQNTKTRSEAAILVIVVFFLGALLGGVGNHVWGERVWGKQVSVAHPSRELQLNAEQQQQLGAIIDDTRSQIRAVYAPADVQREELRQKGRSHIRAILTAEQKPKFEAFMQRLDEERKKSEQDH